MDKEHAPSAQTAMEKMKKETQLKKMNLVLNLNLT